MAEKGKIKILPPSSSWSCHHYIFLELSRTEDVQKVLYMNFFFISPFIPSLTDTSRMEKNKIKIKTPSLNVREQSKIKI